MNGATLSGWLWMHQKQEQIQSAEKWGMRSLN